MVPLKAHLCIIAFDTLMASKAHKFFPLFTCVRSFRSSFCHPEPPFLSITELPTNRSFLPMFKLLLSDAFQFFVDELSVKHRVRNEAELQSFPDSDNFFSRHAAEFGNLENICGDASVLPAVTKQLDVGAALLESHALHLGTG